MKISSDSTKHKALHPRLISVLEIVYSKRPLLEYEVTDVDSDLLGTRVIVWQNGQKIGSVNAVFNRWSDAKSMNEKWYAVESPNIRKERGRRNTKFSKDAKTAARTIIESFAVKPLAELGMTLAMEMRSHIVSMRDRVEHEYRNAISYFNLTLTNYFTDLYMGRNPTMPTKIAEQIVSKDVLRKRESLEIAENVYNHCKNNNGYAVKVMQDNTILFTALGSAETTSKFNSTYELDQYSQEKFTMLKVLDFNQFAANIGIKYETDDGVKKETIYFIVAGETVVHS